MLVITATFPSLTRQCGRRLTSITVILITLFWSSICLGANYLEEEKLDSAAGILDREWRINLIRLATREYLRTRSQVKTGLPNYDQLVEQTRLAPALLYEQLTAKPGVPSSSAPRGSSLPPEVIRNIPAVSPSAMPGSQPSPISQPAPSSQPAPTTSQGPPSPPANISTSPTTPSLPPFDLNPPTVSLPPGAPTPTLPPPSNPGPSVIPGQ